MSEGTLWHLSTVCHRFDPLLEVTIESQRVFQVDPMTRIVFLFSQQLRRSMLMHSGSHIAFEGDVVELGEGH